MTRFGGQPERLGGPMFNPSAAYLAERAMWSDLESRVRREVRGAKTEVARFVAAIHAQPGACPKHGCTGRVTVIQIEHRFYLSCSEEPCRHWNRLII